MITVSVVGGSPIQVNWTSGMNAQQAIEEAYVASPQTFIFSLQYFGSYGYLVIMINQTFETFLPTESPYYYWDFLLNGSPSSTGIDQTTLNDGDAISFLLTTYNATQHTGTLLEVKHRAKSLAFSSN